MTRLYKVEIFCIDNDAVVKRFPNLNNNHANRLLTYLRKRQKSSAYAVRKLPQVKLKEIDDGQTN